MPADPWNQIVTLQLGELCNTADLVDECIQFSPFVRFEFNRIVIKNQADIVRKIRQDIRKMLFERGRSFKDIKIFDYHNSTLCHRRIAVNGIGQLIERDGISLKFLIVKIAERVVHDLIHQLF